MLRRYFIAIILFTIFSKGLFAESYTREYTYTALPVDNESTCRIIAFDQVRTLLLNKIGAHIQQTVKISEESSNHSYARADVEAITANLTEINIIEEKWDKASYYIKAEIQADTRNILDALQVYKNDQSEINLQLLKTLKINEQALEKSREKILRLRKELALAKNETEITSLTKRYIAELNRLSTDEFFVKGFEHHQRKQYSEAINWYLKAAEEGNAAAQQLLGTLYMNGQGTKQDFTMAIYWFDKAAGQNEAIAQYYLGILYLNGNGVEPDISRAFDWLHKSAELGYSLAQYKLGNMYLSGEGVAQKDYMAVHWFRKAAEQRYAKAQFSLGMMYARGKGVYQNEDEAVYWYRNAAELGLDEAKNILDKMDNDLILDQR